jgi:hypothetical protein
MITPIHTPLQMGLDDRKPMTVRLEPELYARAYDTAKTMNRREGDPLMGPFCAWCVKQITLLSFLSEENREFLQGMLRELGRPWHALDLIDALISTVRKEVRAGRLRPTFWSGQINTSKKPGAF